MRLVELDASSGELTFPYCGHISVEIAESKPGPVQARPGLVGSTARCPGKESQLVERIGVNFSISGDLRFLSHQDMLGLFVRALRRTGLKIAYSQGFNPRSRLWLMLPKSVGVACCDDLLLVELGEQCPTGEFAKRLARALPNEISINSFFRLGPGRLPQPKEAVYSLELSEQQALQVAEKIPQLLDAAELIVERLSKRTGLTERLDIRPYLRQIGLRGRELSFMLAISPAGSAKPSEVLAKLDLDSPCNRAKLLRRKVIYESIKTKQVAQQVKKEP